MKMYIRKLSKLGIIMISLLVVDACADLWFQPDHIGGRYYVSPEEVCAKSEWGMMPAYGVCSRRFLGPTQSDQYGDKIFECNVAFGRVDGCSEPSTFRIGRMGVCDNAGEKYISGLGCTCAYPGSDGACGDGPQNGGEQCSTEGNPVNYLNGNKYQRVSDILARRGSQLQFVRTYNGRFNNDKSSTLGMMGLHWSHNYDMRIVNNATAAGFAMAFRADGKTLMFEKSGADWTGPPKYTLISLADGFWRLRYGSTIETYDTSGRLINIQNEQSHDEITLTYINSLIDNTTPYTLLKQVSDNRGNQLTFTYSGRRLTGISSSWGDAVGYSYSNSLLSEVIYADSTSEIYAYHGTSGLLKSITDRKGFRYAEWGYDTAGRATYSQHFDSDDNPIDRFDFDYTHIDSSTAPRVSVTNPLGKTTTYHYQVVAGVKKNVLVEGHPSPNCAAANKSYDYYDNGTLKSKTDWEGNVTTYLRDDWGREISRTEAAGTPDARTITTEYHSEFNKPVKITEPGLITEMTYDSAGRLLNTKKTSTTAQ